MGFNWVPEINHRNTEGAYNHRERSEKDTKIAERLFSSLRLLCANSSAAFAVN